MDELQRVRDNKLFEIYNGHPQVNNSRTLTSAGNYRTIRRPIPSGHAAPHRLRRELMSTLEEESMRTVARPHGTWILTLFAVLTLMAVETPPVYAADPLHQETVRPRARDPV